MYTLINCKSPDGIYKMADASIDSIVTDPPGAIGFMGCDWDTFSAPVAGRHEEKQEAGIAYQEKNPGAPRYGNSCKPTVAKPGERDNFINFIASVMGECRRVIKPGGYALVWAIPRTSHWTAMGLENAGWVIQDCVTHLQAQGFPKHRSKLKPAAEFWWLAWNKAKKATPLPGLDACRVGDNPGYRYNNDKNGTTFHGKQGERIERSAEKAGKQFTESTQGRWPANVIADEDVGLGDASRFFFCPKASVRERGAGIKHPTVKPLALMRYLCRLITPPGGTVLDPFAGTGTTLMACELEGFNSIGIEQKPEYCEIAKQRLASRSGEGVN